MKELLKKYRTEIPEEIPEISLKYLKILFN